MKVSAVPSYEDVLKHNMVPGDPRLDDPAYISPDRMLFIDGTIQSMRSTEKVYHEAMVHPAMFAHSNPKRVAILGGGEGATLREVLKHKTVEAAVMVEIDSELVELSREYLPDFNDCSDLIGRAANCFDDELATVTFQDGRDWFMDRFSSSPKVTEEKFDVLLVDALDPEDPTEVSDGLYSNDSFVSVLVNSLSDDGVMAIQVGTAATIDDPRPDFGVYKNREALFRSLEANPDVKTMFVYEEPDCGFLEPHSFLIVCKSTSCRSRWYARQDQVDYEIYDRIVRTKSKKRALTFFDGTTQRSYQWPKKGWETVYCRREPTPFECAYRNIDPKAEMHEFSLDSEVEGSFRVETKGEGDEKVSQIFATKPIPKGSFIMAEHLASSLLVTTRNLKGLENNRDIGVGRVAVIEDLLEFFEDFAHESAAEGSDQHYVEIAASVLIRRVKADEPSNVKRWIPQHPSGSRPKYSPVYERHRVSFDVFMVASKDIQVGEEVVMHEDMWSTGV
jgi:Spermine/spermidine synthase domain